MPGIHALTSAFVWLGFAYFAAKDAGHLWIDRILQRRGRRKAKQIQPHVAGTRILDLGCGEGYVGAALAEAQANAHGRRNDAVTLCDVADMNRTHLPLRLYDGVTLPFDDDSYDTVVLSLVLHHCADAQQVIREAARVATSRVVVTESTWETKLDHLLINFLDRRANRMRDGALRKQEEHLKFRKVDQWQSMFEQAGLRVERVQWLNRIVHKHVLFVLTPNVVIS